MAGELLDIHASEHGDLTDLPFDPGAIADDLLARYDASGRLVALSPEFSFLEPGVEFGSGLVVRGKDLVLSFGSWDASAHLAVVPVEAALSWLEPV